MTNSAVKTEERAIEILKAWLNSEMTEEITSINTFIDTVSVRCECGETLAYRAFYEGGEKFAVVAVCDCCGDDDAFESEVLEIR